MSAFSRNAAERRIVRNESRRLRIRSGPETAHGENPMTRSMIFASLLSASTAALSLPAQAQTARDLPLDRPATVNDVQMVCTGIGNGEEHNARWRSYPVKLEFVGGYGQYLADENVAIRSRGGAQLVDVRCDAPWIALRLAPGRYSASIDMPGARPKDIDFSTPDTGQHDVIVRYPNKMAGRDSDSQRVQS
jgi:hypothetical protein